MATLIKNGTIVTSTDQYRADLLLDGGQIVSIGQMLPRMATEVIDADGLFILPGGVDPHTHLELPTMGTQSADDFSTGTIAAAFGGTTCIIDFVTPEPEQSLVKALAERRRCAEHQAAIDYSFHACILHLSTTVEDQLDRLITAGISSFKVFMDYPGRLMIDDGTLLRALRWAARSGALLLVHAINGPATAVLVEEAARTGALDPADHGRCRPSILEGEATARAISLAQVAGAPIYIVHVSCSEALEAVRQGLARGAKVMAETCPHYLFLDDRHLAGSDFAGAKYVCNPPLRAPEHGQALWAGLARGDLAVVATDHCPFNFKGQKELGRGDFRKIPNGLPGIETRLMLLHHGVTQGRISLNQLVQLTATRPARIFGLYPQKGTIIVGADADLVLWDPRREVDLSAACLHMNVDYSIYEGWQLRGGPQKVFLRGKLIIDGPRYLGSPGEGRFLRRKLIYC